MDKRIIEITTDLFVKLPANVASFTQSDLSKAGFPPFLVKRVLFHTYNRVLDTIHLPDQLWLSWDSDELLQAREELLKVIKKEVRIPSDIAKEIIRQAVKECLEMTIQPRRSISKYLFGDEIELELKAIAGRASSITVNRYLIWSLIRYMERKEKVSVTREQADHILGKIDEKIVQNYHPLNWLSLVKPLFDMAGTKVHTDLIRLFFEDKRNNRAAKQFDMLNKTISETQFIEVMSSPDLLNVEGFRDDQQALFQEPVSGKSVNEDAENHKFMQSADEKDNASLPVEEEPDLPERFEEPSDTVAPWIDEEEEEEEVEGEVDEEEKEKEEVIGDVSGDERTLNDVLQADKKENEEDQEAEEQEESFADESLEEEDISPDQTLLEAEDMDSGGKDEIGVEAIEISDSDESEEVDTFKEEGFDLQNKPEEDLTLANRFMFDESDLENDLSRNLSVDDDNDEEEEETSTIYDDLNLIRKDTEPTTLDLFESDVDFNFSDDRSETDKKVDSDLELPGKEERSESRESTKGKEDPTPVEDDDSDSESDLPMWRSFLEREDVDSGSSFEFDDTDYRVEESEISSGGPDDETETETETETEMDVEDKERLDEDGFIEEPIYDLTKEEPAIEQKIGGLNEWMLDEKDTFIEELFGDSEDAYEQALADIIEFEDWKQASRYIEKEIFTRNRIDVYDEIAVDFTDRLHSYFLENKS